MPPTGEPLECTLEELRSLMELRGEEALHKVCFHLFLWLIFDCHYFCIPFFFEHNFYTNFFFADYKFLKLLFYSNFFLPTYKNSIFEDEFECRKKNFVLTDTSKLNDFFFFFFKTLKRKQRQRQKKKKEKLFI